MVLNCYGYPGCHPHFAFPLLLQLWRLGSWSSAKVIPFLLSTVMGSGLGRSAANSGQWDWIKNLPEALGKNFETTLLEVAISPAGCEKNSMVALLPVPWRSLRKKPALWTGEWRWGAATWVLDDIIVVPGWINALDRDWEKLGIFLNRSSIKGRQNF